MHNTLCNIAIESPDLPRAEFDRRYREPAVPVVIRNATTNLTEAISFRASTTIPALVESFGEAQVTLSSANAFSYGRRRISVAQYLSEALGPEASAMWNAAADDDSAAASQFYWFGEHGEELAALTSMYPLPVYTYPEKVTLSVVFASATSSSGEQQQQKSQQQQSHPPALSFGVGPDGSGVPFHFHADGFSEVMHGAKHWLLYPHKPPRFRENATSVSWLRHDYPALKTSERPRECYIGPGDLLYFPKGWWHAIINRGDPTVFMSTFL